jgi:hypothetical protein
MAEEIQLSWLTCSAPLFDGPVDVVLDEAQSLENFEYVGGKDVWAESGVPRSTARLTHLPNTNMPYLQGAKA